MASHVAAIERLEDHPIGVDPAAIEDEFARIWQETSGAGFDESAVRLRVANFIGIAADAAARDRFEEVMSLLPQRHPCRGIFALAVDGPDRLDAVISAHCWRSGGARRHVCSEQVVLTASRAHERELASTVLPLLVPELPVTTWLISEASPDSYLASEVLAESDLVLFDSAAYDDVRRAFFLPVRLRERHDVPAADLAWLRLTTHRALIAQLFDGEDGARELAQIREMHVRGDGGARSPEPLLLAGWLASRLRMWPADIQRDGEHLVATLYRGSRAVRLIVEPAASSLPFEEVTLLTGDASFNVACHAESGHIHVREQWDGGSTRRVVEQPPLDDPAVILRALDGIEDLPVFEEALEAARHLAAAEPPPTG